MWSMFWGRDKKFTLPQILDTPLHRTRTVFPLGLNSKQGGWVLTLLSLNIIMLAMICFTSLCNVHLDSHCACTIYYVRMCCVHWYNHISTTSCVLQLSAFLQINHSCKQVGAPLFKYRSGNTACIYRKGTRGVTRIDTQLDHCFIVLFELFLFSTAAFAVRLIMLLIVPPAEQKPFHTPLLDGI